MVPAFNLIAIVSAVHYAPQFRSRPRPLCPGGNFNQRKLKHKPGQDIPTSPRSVSTRQKLCRMKVKRSRKQWPAMKLKAVTSPLRTLSLCLLVRQSIAGIIFILLPASPQNRTNEADTVTKTVTGNGRWNGIQLERETEPRWFPHEFTKKFTLFILSHKKNRKRNKKI